MEKVNYWKDRGVKKYWKKDVIIYVNRLKKEEYIIKYEYEYFEFWKDFEKKDNVENIGKVVFGERIRK